MKNMILAALFGAALALGVSITHADPTPSPSITMVSGVNLSMPTPVASVPVAEPAAPPAWAQDVIVFAQKLPILGPIVSKVMIYLGILSSILTLLVGAALGVLQTLKGAFNLAGLDELAVKIAAFSEGKFMYWLKYFSMFNAKKKPEPTPPTNPSNP